jgi:chromodomain-helicase-DNA-binding protein 7
MVDGVGKICKEAQDAADEEHAKKGKVERCSVCASSKKGRCGTETAPKSCLNLSDELRKQMNAADEDADTAVPVGMTRATWDAVTECCEKVLASREDSLPPAAFTSLGRPCVYKRMSSGWARGTKALKERNALAAAVEVPGYNPEKGTFDETDGPNPPPELDEFEFSEMMKPTSGAWSRWWGKECDAALLRGSLRYGFSPWSQGDLEAQFECILKDNTLWFANNAVGAADEDKDKKADAEHSARIKAAAVVHDAAKKALNDDKDKETHELKLKERREMLEEANRLADEGPRRMPGRETLKRRILGLLKNLIDPPAKKEVKPPKPPKEVKPRKPTKAELAEIRKAERLARDEENAQKFKDSLTGGGGGALKVAFKIPKKEDPSGADDKDSDAAKDEQPASPKPTQDQGNGEASAEILPRTSPAAGATTSHENKSDVIDKKIDAFGALMTTKKEKKEQKPKKEKKEKKEKRPADGTTAAEKPKKRRKKKDAGVADTKSADDDAGAEKAEPEKKAEAAVLDAVIDAEVAALEPALEPEETPAVEAPAAPAAAPTVAPPARRPALDFAEIPDDADPLTSCVLSSLNANKTPAAKTHVSSFLTPGSSGPGGGLKKLPAAGGMKKPGVKSGLGSGQTSLFGFFKTPAPATNQERGFRAMNTPTTGDFIAM